jgi:L-proline 4-hydroxylase
MQLTDRQSQEFAERGYLLVSSLFTADEVDVMRAEMPVLMADDSPRRVLEKDQQTVRALHGCHQVNEVFRRLAAHPRILEPARQILGSAVYVHQFKINVKAAFAGDVWRWHQDFIFWRKEDGMQAPRAVNAIVFLDDVTEFNGPLYLVPGSQSVGMIDVDPLAAPDRSWRASFAADLKYTVTREMLDDLVGRFGLVSPKGPSGSVLFTHCNLVHGSPPNMSPTDRRLAIVTYNSVDNPLLPVEHPRPGFLVARDFTPINPLDDDTLRTANRRGAPPLRG